MFASIVNTFTNCFKIPELKSRILFTIMVLAICRFAAFVHVPGLDSVKLASIVESSNKSGGLGLLGMFSGGAAENCAIGALGIMPYISATIVLQLLTAVYAPLSKMAREEGGRGKIIQYGRYLTVLLCIGWGAVTALGWEHPDTTFHTSNIGRLILYPDTPFWVWYYRIQTVLIL